MKYLLSFFLAFALIMPTVVDAATRVSGYYKKNGTYVQPYYRSDKNSVKSDNYSCKGNINPYTGKRGSSKC